MVAMLGICTHWREIRTVLPDGQQTIVSVQRYNWIYIQFALSCFKCPISSLSQSIELFLFSENCVAFLINVRCPLAQFKMLNVLCSYLEGATDPIEKLWPLFDGKFEDNHFNGLKSIEWFTNGSIPFAMQLHLLEHINLRASERWAFSELIYSVKFDDSSTINCAVSGIEFFRVGFYLGHILTVDI